jgi:hypothetical protein
MVPRAPFAVPVRAASATVGLLVRAARAPPGPLTQVPRAPTTVLVHVPKASFAVAEGVFRRSRTRAEGVRPLVAATDPTPVVRIRARLRPPSTDSVTFRRPHPGDWEVVPIVSTGAAVERPSGQVNPLWIRGRRLSTDCGRRKDPQGVYGVVHRRPTGLSRLSPVIPSFSTPLSTVRQLDAPSHRVE